jgi:hypothetical protein
MLLLLLLLLLRYRGRGLTCQGSLDIFTRQQVPTHLESRKGRLPVTALTAAWCVMAMPVPNRLWVSY